MKIETKDWYYRPGTIVVLFLITLVLCILLGLPWWAAFVIFPIRYFFWRGVHAWEEDRKNRTESRRE